jgi:hypothetical protein
LKFQILQMNKEQKLKQALKLTEAMKTKSEAFVLMEKLDRLEDKVDNIKIPETKPKEDEEIIIELSII